LNRVSTTAQILLFIGLVPGHISAQTALPEIRPKPQAGDCSLTVILPPGANPDRVVLTLDSDAAPLTFTVMQRAPLVAGLKQPLLANSQVTVTIGGASATAKVAASSGGMVPATCDGNKTTVFDEREVFEASGFLGVVIDTFAPAINGNYVNPDAAMHLHSRLTAGVDSQYRVWGAKNDVRQLWITGYVLNGMRTADAPCSDTPTNADCLKMEMNNPVGSFNYILAHATTIEAHVDARLELFRIQGDTDVPAKLYLFGRAGFLDLAGAPQLYDANSLGVGIIAPKGVFRNSYAQAGWGNSRQYITDPKFDRFKVNGVLVFDVIPNLSVSNIGKALASSWRFFIAISIDRNFHNGPDAVQTYLGFDFDLRRIFGSF
jgi:hypothetical protein